MRMCLEWKESNVRRYFYKCVSVYKPDREVFFWPIHCSSFNPRVPGSISDLGGPRKLIDAGILIQVQMLVRSAEVQLCHWHHIKVVTIYTTLILLINLYTLAFSMRGEFQRVCG